MSYLSKLDPSKRGAVGRVVEVVEYGAAAYAFGYLQNRYREKASVMGVPADLAAGVVLKAASLAGDLLGKGGQLVAHANNLGNAGVGAYFHTLGAGHGAQASGVKRLLISEKDLAKAKAALPNSVVLGEIPKAPHGDFLTASDLAALAK